MWYNYCSQITQTDPIMKKILILLLPLFSFSLSAQQIRWMSMEEALEAQIKKPKKIFMDVYTNWCGPCKLMEKNTLNNKHVSQFINENFYAVKFNAEGNEVFEYQGNTYSNPNYKAGRKGRNSQHIFASSLKITGYPTMAFFDERSNFIFPITGYHTPEQLEIYLKLIQSNDYKAITSQKAFLEYENEFQGTFTNN